MFHSIHKKKPKQKKITNSNFSLVGPSLVMGILLGYLGIAMLNISKIISIILLILSGILWWGSILYLLYDLLKIPYLKYNQSKFAKNIPEEVKI